ncbi:hypothetical protein PMAYCL1PPCAC_25466, partial [Pristionchus mayeri]
LISEHKFLHLIESGRLLEIFLCLFHNGFHLELIRKIHDMRHNTICDLGSSRIDQIKKIYEFVVDDIFDLHFFLILLSEIAEKHGSEDRRVHGK